MADIKKGKGVGYTDPKTGKVCMVKCFKCGRDNRTSAITTGTCGWCGHDANKSTAKKQVKAVELKGAIDLLILHDRLKLGIVKRRNK